MFLHLWALNLHYHTWQASDQVTMALAFNNEHIVYYHMDALWSMALMQTNFTHPDYLGVQCLVHTTYLSPDTITQPGPQNYGYV